MLLLDNVFRPSESNDKTVRFWSVASGELVHGLCSRYSKGGGQEKCT